MSQARVLSNYPNASLTNKIINGCMRIDQRNAGANVNYSGGAYYITDRFMVALFGSTYASPAMSAQQVTDAPQGFVNSLKITSAATNTPDSNKLGCWINQPIEGLNITDLGWGTANAQSITVTFRVKASKTGNVSVSLENSARDRSYVTTVTINSAATWETKTVTIPGDTSGTWLTNNGVGIDFKIGVMSNGSWLAGAGGSWLAGRNVLSASQTNFIATSGDYIAITGVDLRKGSYSTAPTFDMRQYGTELLLCQRYFEKDVIPFWVNGTFGAGSYQSYGHNNWAFHTSKRAVPTTAITFSSNIDNATGAGLVNPYTGGFIATLNINSYNSYPYARAYIVYSADSEL